MLHTRDFRKRIARAFGPGTALAGMISLIVTIGYIRGQSYSPAFTTSAHLTNQVDEPASRPATTEPDDATRARVGEAYARLPLSFEANQGQTDPEVKFIARGPGYSLFLTPGEAVMVMTKPDAGQGNTRVAGDGHKGEESDRRTDAAERVVLRMKFVGANPKPRVAGLEKLPNTSNYFVGNDPAKWRTGVTTYGKVKYEKLYAGVDLVYYGNQRQLEYDFVVAPGADPDAARLRFDGAERIRIDADGELVLRVGGGEVRQHRPVGYQEVDGTRREIEARYVLTGEREIGFQVGKYDTGRPLVIDPVR